MTHATAEPFSKTATKDMISESDKDAIYLSYIVDILHSL